MARLPTPKLTKVKGKEAKDGKQRWDMFKSLVRKAVDRRYIADQKKKGGTKHE